MFRRIVMLCSVPVRRVVATTNVAAHLAETKMNPSAAYLQAIFTAFGAWRDGDDVLYVSAIIHITLVYRNLTPLDSPIQTKLKSLTFDGFENRFTTGD